jgi:glycosyltransferase involved in cell wall biosynthesis
LFTTFESSRLPSYWVESINRHYHACVVPHQHVARAFSESGVRVPLHLVQQGFTRFRRPSPTERPRSVFRIGFLGVPVRRKNLHKLVSACSRLSSTIPELRLAVHVSHWYDWLHPGTWDDVRSAPFVEWSEGVRTNEEIANWFGRLSCYAYPSSGEGWSYTPRESLFLGVPTILSAIPVHAELVNSGFCTPIPVRGTEAAAFEGVTSGTWGRIDVDDVAGAIREVYVDPRGAETRAAEGARWIESRWLDADTRRCVLDVVATA